MYTDDRRQWHDVRCNAWRAGPLAAARAREKASSAHASEQQIQRLAAGLVHQAEFSQLGAAETTLRKDDLAWQR